MPRNKGLGAFWKNLFGGAPKGGATPEETVQAHFAAIVNHDLDGIMETLSPERAKLYADARTLDRRRLTVTGVRVIGAVPAAEAIPLPPLAERYRERLVLRVEYELSLVSSEERRDPSLQEGIQWSFYVLVREKPGRPWLIADWGR